MIRTLAALALVALISAGCGSNAPSETATASSTATADRHHKKLTRQEKAVKFAECMRANGVPHFPDPDPKGDIELRGRRDREVWLKAVDACKALQATGRVELEADAQAAVGEPEVRPVRSRARREGLPGPRQR